MQMDTKKSMAISPFQDEIEMVHRIITHSGGFNLVLRAGLYLKPNGFDWEVGWREIIKVEKNTIAFAVVEVINDTTICEGQILDFYKFFPEALEAATFFVEKRHQMKYGEEYKK